MSLSQLEFIRHMVDECEFILKTTKNKMQDDIIADSILNRALLRSLEIIGEAAKRIEDDFKTKYAQVNWKEMARMRDKLIHHYFGIDYDVVYNTIQNDIPELYHELKRVIDLEKNN